MVVSREINGQEFTVTLQAFDLLQEIQDQCKLWGVSNVEYDIEHQKITIGNTSRLSSVTDYPFEDSWRFCHVVYWKFGAAYLKYTSSIVFQHLQYVYPKYSSFFL